MISRPVKSICINRPLPILGVFAARQILPGRCSYIIGQTPDAADNATHMYGWTLLGTTLVNRSFNRIASFSSEVSCLAIVGDDLREALFTPLTGSKSCQVFETKRRGGWRGFDIDALGEKVSFLRKNGTFRISANFFFFFLF